MNPSSDTRMLSYLSSPQVEPFMYVAATDSLRHWAQRDPERDAFVMYGADGVRQAISRQELLVKTTKLAKHLIALGLRKGDSVGFLMESTLDMLICQFGVLFAGGIPFYMTTKLTDGKDILEEIVTMDTVLLMVDPGKDNNTWKYVNPVVIIKESQCDKTAYSITTLKAIVFTSDPKDVAKPILLHQMLALSEVPDVDLPEIQAEDIYVTFPTSGSTGKPKMVAHTHFSLLSCIRQLYRKLGIGEKDVYFCDRPFGWYMGHPHVFLTTGAKRVSIDPHLTASGQHVKLVSDIIEKEGCTSAFLSPYAIIDIISQHGLKEKFKSLNLIVTSGQNISDSLTKITDGYCKTFCLLYGSTEAGASAYYACSKVETWGDGLIGLPLPGMEIKVADKAGNAVRQGEVGEFQMRSVYRLQMYVKNAEKTSEIIDDLGWVKVGDLGYLAENGLLFIRGRTSDVINVGVQKVYPSEVEKIVKGCPGVKNAMIVGVPDPRFREVVCACVVPLEGHSLTMDDVEKYCESKYVHYRTMAPVQSAMPKYFLKFENLPLTTSGKFDRRALAKKAREQLSL